MMMYVQVYRSETSAFGIFVCLLIRCCCCCSLLLMLRRRRGSYLGLMCTRSRNEGCNRESESCSIGWDSFKNSLVRELLVLSLLADAPSSILAALNGRSDCYRGIHISRGNYANLSTAARAGWIGSRRGSSTNLMWQLTYVEYAPSQDGDWESLEGLPRD